MMPINLLSLNEAQLQAKLSNAPILVMNWSRAAGKTTILGDRIEQIAYEMPGSKTVFQSKTLALLYENILEDAVGYLQTRGYTEGIHYVFRRKSPQFFDKPRKPVSTYDDVLMWHTGAYFVFVGQDRPGSNRGGSVDHVVVDEALMLNGEKIQREVFKKNRGNVGVWKSALHHGITIATSKPNKTTGQWIYDLGKYYESDGHDYSKLLHKKVHLELLFVDTDSMKEREKIWKEILEIRKQIVWYKSKPKNLQDTAIYYSEANVFDNIQNVGFKYIKQERMTSTDLIFQVELLNLTPDITDESFYANFDEERHVYDAINYSHIDAITFTKDRTKSVDCRQDTGTVLLEGREVVNHDMNAPIDLCFDYGGKINTLLAAQEKRDINYYLYQNNFFVKKPQLLNHLVNKFCDYYEPHKRKEVDYYFNKTAKVGQSNNIEDFKSVTEVLQSRGWIVNQHDEGDVVGHHDRYKFWGRAFLENDPRLPKFRINRKCKELIISIKMAPLDEDKNGYRKDKRSERSTMAQEHATHFSDAFDDLAYAKFGNILTGQSSFQGMAIG